MEPVKQILRLHQDGFSIKAIVRLTGISRPTVKKYLRRLQQAGQENLPPTSGNEPSPSAIVYNATIPSSSPRHQVLLDHFSYAEKELSKPGATKQLLWLEYKDHHPDGYGYSQARIKRMYAVLNDGQKTSTLKFSIASPGDLRRTAILSDSMGLIERTYWTLMFSLSSKSYASSRRLGKKIITTVGRMKAWPMRPLANRRKNANP